MPEEIDESGIRTGPLSPSDTIPASPKPLSEFEEKQQPFARLSPINDAARRAFDSAVDAIKRDQDAHAHVRRNIVFESVRQESVSVASEFTDSENTETHAQNGPPSHRFKGFFCFRLDNPPRVPRNGWILGDGRNSAAGQVDFLLSAPRQTRDIAGKHVAIYPHPRSCRLLLQARHRTTMQASDTRSMITTLSKSDSATQLTSAEQIHIGDCIYLFDYLDSAISEAHQEQLTKFMKQTHGSGWTSLLHIINSSSSSEIPNMRLHTYSWPLGAFAGGTFGQVAAGTASNGDPIAVKRFYKPREEQLSAHRRMMSHIGRHPNIIHLLDCFAGPEAHVPEAYCMYEPLASSSLHDILGQEVLSTTAQIALFRQFSEALAFLHDEKGVMHRDIKPRNLGILSLHPPAGIIFDFDSATREEISVDHMQGTISYLAPEIVALKQWEEDRGRRPRPPPYGREVDIWALGISAHVTLTEIQMGNLRVTPDMHRRICQGLKRQALAHPGSMQAAYASIIVGMLCWDIRGRLSASGAVEAFHRLEGQFLEEDTMTDTREPGMKRPREDS